jgi:hypothetical protein
MLMGFLKRMLLSDIEPTPAELDRVEETKTELDLTRGEYRQAVQRIESKMRVMTAWESANRMARE